jgi:dolichol-phosphate mannosyltransferase
MNQTVILLPTYNERENIITFIPELFATIPEAKVVVIDDSSPDGTGAVVQELASRYSGLSLLSREKKEGLGVAYKHGFRHVLAMPGIERVVLMDADGSHDTAYLRTLIEGCVEHDIVIGSRYVKGGSVEGWEYWRYMLSRYGNLYAQLLTGLPIHDLTAGFYCMKRNLLERFDLDALTSSGYAFQIDLKFHAIHERGARVREIPIHFKQRREGESKLSRHIISEGLLAPLVLLRRRFHL